MATIVPESARIAALQQALITQAGNLGQSIGGVVRRRRDLTQGREDAALIASILDQSSQPGGPGQLQGQPQGFSGVPGVPGGLDIPTGFQQPTPQGLAAQGQNFMGGLAGILPLLQNPQTRQAIQTAMLGQQFQQANPQAQATLAKTRAETQALGVPTPTTRTQQEGQLLQKIANGTATPNETAIADRLFPLPTTSNERFQQATTLRKEFNAQPDVKNFDIVQNQVGIIREAFNEATTGDVKSRIASDQALVVAFNKMLDPGSVVRESEFARTPEQAAILNRFLAFPGKAKLGGLAITNEDRQSILDMSERAAAVSGERYNRQYDRAKMLADRSSIDSQDIFGGLTRFSGATNDEILDAGAGPRLTPQLEFQQNADRIAELEAKARGE